jgi:hypothetical protein
MTGSADLKSAGHSAVQILYKLSPECSKTPQNTLLQPLSHNNIRKTGSIRNRQVTSSILVVGSILSITCDQFTAKCCTSYFRLELIHGFGSIASTGWSEPVPERQLHPLKSSPFSRRTFSTIEDKWFLLCEPASGNLPNNCLLITMFCRQIYNGL